MHENLSAFVSSPEKLLYPKKLYHVSAWSGLEHMAMGDTFVLKPGQQKAEGLGVYFSEKEPRINAADGVQRLGGYKSAIVVIEVRSPKNWWRSKNATVNKNGRSRTWHSSGKNIQCTIQRESVENGTRYLFCDWEFIEAIN